MDVSTVKTEIKAWERSFRSSNGRDPTIQDIKVQPEIADKYRLYKKLSKTNTSSLPFKSNDFSSDPPSTPPRSRSRSHQPLPCLLVQPRVIETTAPLSSFNPFSPQKNKGKEKASAVVSRSHPFTSPFKSKAPPLDPFSLLHLPKSAASVTPPNSPPAANTAISRARKRLRGEPVSPSPNKGKRRRIGSQTTLPFPKLPPESSSNEDESEHDVNSSFVSDSPVKAPAGGKSFKLLFDETTGPKSLALRNGKASITRTKGIPPVHGLFRGKSAGGLDEDATWVLDSVERREHTPAPPKQTAGLAADGSVYAPKAKMLTDQKEPRKRGKRSLSDAESEALETPHELPSAGPHLLPPSPPPVDSSTYRSRHPANPRGKAVLNGWKKAKTATDHDGADGQIEEDEEDSDTLQTNVKIVDRTPTRFLRTTASGGEHDFQSDPDPILAFSRRVEPRGHEAAFPPDAELEGRFEVDLPDKLRLVLALQTTESKIRDSREERVVQELVLGRRATHYDPAKGGEIWDVGEDDLRRDGEEDTRRDTEYEDDWEGEPVPWEVGEL